VRPTDTIRRTPWGLGLAAAVLIAFDLLVIWPAWMGRAEIRQELEAAQEQLAEQRRLTSTIAANRERYAEKRSALLQLEADLVPASEDTSLIRQVESLAGGGIRVQEYRAQDAVPLAPERTEKGDRTRNEEESAGSGPYSRVPYELTAAGSWEDLTLFLKGLETQVTGLRVEGVELTGDRAGSGNTLKIVGSLYRVETPLPDLAEGEAATARN